MNPASDNHPWTRMKASCPKPVRVLELHHVHGDTYAIFEDGGVYLSDGATLKTLLEQLSGRGNP
jgi:hypothetical protein